MTLEQLWAGWRHEYVRGATEAERRGEDGDCVFCALAAAGEPREENAVVRQGLSCFAALNAYPYASGHLLVMCRRHVGDLGDLRDEEATELWEMCRSAVAAVTAAYAPDGVNMGANFGRAAGAGIPGHLHVHVVPRWSGDTNFMTTVGGVRVMPEALSVSWQRLVEAWPAR